MWRPAPVSDLLTALLRGTPAEKRIREGGIWEVWDVAVGKGIAVHAQPIAFRDGTLTLSVDSAPWMQQLTFLKHDLIAKVNERLGEEMVKDIYMKQGKIATDSVRKPHKPRRRELSVEEREWIKEQSESVTDPDLRAVFERLIERDRENR
jgi:predicted nucleic acid-binding Zn ribbon protein